MKKTIFKNVKSGRKNYWIFFYMYDKIVKIKKYKLYKNIENGRKTSERRNN